MFDSFQSYTLSWLQLAGLLWCSLMLEFPSVRGLLGKGWLASFVPAVSVQILPLGIVFLFSFLCEWLGMSWASAPLVSERGFVFSLRSDIRFLSEPFLHLVAAAIFAVITLKLSILRLAAQGSLSLFPLVSFVVSCTLSTAIFVSGIVFDKREFVAMVRSRTPASDALKKTEPLRQQYESVEEVLRGH